MCDVSGCHDVMSIQLGSVWKLLGHEKLNLENIWNFLDINKYYILYIIYYLRSRRYIYLNIHVYTTKKNNTQATIVKNIIKHITLLFDVWRRSCMPFVTLSNLDCTVVISLPNSSKGRYLKKKKKRNKWGIESKCLLH